MKQRKFGIPLLPYLRENKKFLWLVLAGGVGLIVFSVYILVLQPILCRFFITKTDIHEGVQHYQDLSFIEFESGEIFSCLVRETEFDKLGQVMDFYHIDNHVRDNPVYGKHCDVFALDIQMEQGAFLHYQNEIVSKSQYCGVLGDFELYLLYAFDSSDKEQGEIVLIAFDTRVNVARLILLTDKDPVALTSGYISTLLRNASMDWS